MNTRAAQLEAVNRLLDVMDELREKCPWDRKQTMESLRSNTIEEVYELGDALLSGDLQEIKKELGDVLLHLVFYSKIGSETQAFDFGDVAQAITEKLISRHPHIYGEVQLESEEEVAQNWEKLKLAEGNTSVLAGVPQSLPALVKASRIQEKVKGVGFDWSHKEEVWQKVEEEIAEFKKEEALGNAEGMEDEFGDVLFSLINYARFVSVNPESALERTNKKFIKRFKYIEVQALGMQKSISALTLEEMNGFWEAAKKI